jgi:hypothetical protein
MGRSSARYASDDAGAYPFDYECANATRGEVSIVRLPGFDVELAVDSGAAPQSHSDGRRFDNSCSKSSPHSCYVFGRMMGPAGASQADPSTISIHVARHMTAAMNARGYLAYSCDRPLVNRVAGKISSLTAKGRAALAVWILFTSGWSNPFADSRQPVR